MSKDQNILDIKDQNYNHMNIKKENQNIIMKINKENKKQY